jgi:hypothetical protein
MSVIDYYSVIINTSDALRSHLVFTFYLRQDKDDA